MICRLIVGYSGSGGPDTSVSILSVIKAESGEIWR